jgi:hypothetical protein
MRTLFAADITEKVVSARFKSIFLSENISPE